MQVLEVHSGRPESHAVPQNTEILPARRGNSINVLHSLQHPADAKQMFKFQGHFQPPNNPELPAGDHQIGVHRPAAVMPAGTEQPTPQADHSAAAHAADIHSDLSDASPAADMHQQFSAQSFSLTSPSTAAVHKAQHQSEFRRSHSPEWYDTKFKNYVLRCVYTATTHLLHSFTLPGCKDAAYWHSVSNARTSALYSCSSKWHAHPELVVNVTGQSAAVCLLNRVQHCSLFMRAILKLARTC